MSPTARTQASRKYNDKSLVRYSLSLNINKPEDVELIDFITAIKAKRSLNGFIKELLRENLDKEI